ncbi:uncharacterized protein LOC123540515 [Mercenaria mercenaria]|uniref:uncharacterized protein LOC123540515 n=1 Tax=Mercenaria mercenaria TaxID=6596 RepID=UPI00234F974F|nr:uncharacterized protein LOC123540515 [Mercenaria mercenaria]
MNLFSRLSLDDVWVFLYILSCIIYEADSITYHTSFLGRNTSASVPTPVGILLQKTTGTLPVITNNVTSCSYSTSNWGVATGFNAITFDASGCSELVPNGTEIGRRGIKVESPDNFTLHVIQSNVNGLPGDGYLAIPDEHLGTEYYVITYCSTGGFCQFAVSGTADDTKIEITFPNNIQTNVVCVNGIPLESSTSSGTEIPFVINELDVLHFESEQDLTGSYVSANKEIAVFVGARDVPNDQGTTSDMIEQIPPVSKWGTEFVVVPNYLNDAGDIVKIVTQEDNTVVEILGFSPFIIPKAGEGVERRFDWQMHSTVHASEPVLMVQVMNLELYNISGVNTPSGSVAMVLVPHREQWVDTEHYFHCTLSAQNESLIAVVSDSDTSSLVLVQPSPAVHFSPWSGIDGSSYDAMIAEPAHTETSISGSSLRSMYGFCEGKYAVLLGANWDWENEGCVRTLSSPGDDRDNDCSGQIDEDNCTSADLDFSFTSVQTAGGVTNYTSLIVRGAGHINISITTCDVAVLTLKTRTDPEASITIKISPSAIVEQICISECFAASVVANTVTDCTNEQLYSIEWFEDNVGLKHIFQTVDTEYRWDIDNVFGVSYDELVLSTIAGSADFVIGLPDKDCNKIISGGADTSGQKFVIPVSSDDNDFTIMLSTRNDLASTITIELNVENSLGVLTMSASETLLVEEAMITESVFSSITLSATGGEVSVYLLRSTISSEATGLTILPTDVLGPSYLLFVDRSININDTTAKLCDAFATDRTTDSNYQTISLNWNTEILNDIDELLLTADRPVAVFCGTFGDTLIQMPPKESLGLGFYIPKLDLDSINAEAEIHIITADDSTVLIVKGDYDQMDPVDFTGDIYIRAVVPNTIYRVSATKPVQVQLQIWSDVGGWASSVVIPPVQQYKSDHVFPGLDNTLFQLSFSSAVNVNGTEVISQVTPAALTANIASTFVYSEGPTFSLTVLTRIMAHPGETIIIPSDVLYEDNNEICRLTTGYPGDGIDNDCDGLVDEEHCSDSKVPGDIDYDLDGSMNEDCSATTNATSSSVQLPIPLSIVTCTSNVTNTSSGDTVINIDHGDYTSTDPVNTPDASTVGSEPTYDPLVATGVSVVLPTTTSAPGSASAPEETCVSDCVCPCGWVNPPQNYTAEELQIIVLEIQEKLKVSKAELSSTIRKKTSAKDDRPSATAVGYVGLASIIVFISAMALLDITTLFRDMKILMSNLREVFQP